MLLVDCGHTERALFGHPGSVRPAVATFMVLEALTAVAPLRAETLNRAGFVTLEIDLYAIAACALGCRLAEGP
ncbi:MAG: hypothetical protein R3C27_15205 [Hyphomonadaceae bacterium]